MAVTLEPHMPKQVQHVTVLPQELHSHLWISGRLTIAVLLCAQESQQPVEERVIVRIAQAFGHQLQPVLRQIGPRHHCAIYTVEWNVSRFMCVWQCSSHM